MAFSLILAMTILCGCTQTGNNSEDMPSQGEEPSGSVSTTPNEETPEPEKELPYAYILSPDFDRQDGITIPQFYFGGDPVAFDFNEFLDEGYPLGDWSVDELEKKYGKAEVVKGSLEYEDQLFVIVNWADMSVVLQTSRNGAISFDPNLKGGEDFTISDQDKTVKIPVREIRIYGSACPLPRGLEIWHSTLEEIKSAYSVKGEEVIDSPAIGAHSIVYKYADFNKLALKQTIEKADIGYVEYRLNKEVLSTVAIGIRP